MVRVQEHGHEGAGELRVKHTAQQVRLLLLHQTRGHGCGAVSVDVNVRPGDAAAKDGQSAAGSRVHT